MGFRGEATILSAKADQLARDVPQNGGELWIIRTLSETGVEPGPMFRQTPHRPLVQTGVDLPSQQLAGGCYSP